MAEAFDAGELVEALQPERDADFFPLNDLPNDLLVSVFAVAAAEDSIWVRRTFPVVCKAWNELYLTKDASPLHQTLEVNFAEEVERAKQERLRRVARPLTGAAAQELAPHRHVVRGSRVISWAQGRAGSVRKLHLKGMIGRGYTEVRLPKFSAEDLGTLVAVVGPSLTEISMKHGLGKFFKRPFWESLRDSVVPARRLRSLVLRGDWTVANESDVEPLGQLAGSLEELELVTELIIYHKSEDSGLPCFPESFCALTELRRLDISAHPRITAIPAGISSLKKLTVLDLRCCDLSSLPKELGELSRLTKLDLSYNKNLGSTLPTAEAFPAELGRMKSLRDLGLSQCGLRTVPAFVGGLESLEVLRLSYNDDLQIDAPLDFLLEGCPRLREVHLYKKRPWAPESLAHLEAFKAKLLAVNPDAEVVLG